MIASAAVGVRRSLVRFEANRDGRSCPLRLAALAHERWFVDLGDRISLACLSLSDRGAPLSFEDIADAAGLDVATVRRYRVLVECYRR